MNKETFLFDDIIFGPVKSRRLGISLGINLLPTKQKICTFDCIYCECGFNEDQKIIDKLPKREAIKEALSFKLNELLTNNIVPNVITFAGNGEPTIHPEFSEIVDDTIALRNQLVPEAKIAVLTNSTMLHKENVWNTLKKIDNPILKLDGGNQSIVETLDKPNRQFSFEKTVEKLIEFGHKASIQTMFLKGEVEGKEIDNSSEKEVEEWLQIIHRINPNQVMIYTIDRATPLKTLKKIEVSRLNEIAKKVSELGIKTQVSG